MTRSRKDTTRPADPYVKAIAELERAIVALVGMTTSEVGRHSQCSAFTLLNLGEVGLSGLESVFHRTRDAPLRRRIVEILRGASLTHGASVLPILGRLMGSDDLDPLLQALVRSSFAEAASRTARPETRTEVVGPTEARPGGGPASSPASDPGEDFGDPTRTTSFSP